MILTKQEKVYYQTKIGAQINNQTMSYLREGEPQPPKSNDTKTNTANNVTYAKQYSNATIKQYFGW